MKGKVTFTQTETDTIISLIEQKLKSDSTTQKSIRQKIRNLGFYAKDDFGISGGYTVEDFLKVVTIINGKKNESKIKPIIKIREKTTSTRNLSDEAYILDLCDETLNLKGVRQYRFDFLRGDKGTKLPVDVFYASIKLVIEYREKQHTEEVKFFDKKITASGITRSEQRKKYDELRRTEIPKNDLSLIEFDYSEFGHNQAKRLLRERDKDIKIIEKKLRNYIEIK